MPVQLPPWMRAPNALPPNWLDQGWNQQMPAPQINAPQTTPAAATPSPTPAYPGANVQVPQSLQGAGNPNYFAPQTPDLTKILQDLFKFNQPITTTAVTPPNHAIGGISPEMDELSQKYARPIEYYKQQLKAGLMSPEQAINWVMGANPEARKSTIYDLAALGGPGQAATWRANAARLLGIDNPYTIKPAVPELAPLGAGMLGPQAPLGVGVPAGPAMPPKFGVRRGRPKV